MKCKLLLLLTVAFILVIVKENFGQTAIKGRIIDYHDELPVPGAGIRNGMDGWAVGEDGTFETEFQLEDREFEISLIAYYTVKFVNVPTEKKIIDLKDIKLVRNLFIYDGPIEDAYVERYKEKVAKLKKQVLKKYRIRIGGKKLKPYFEGKYLIFDFNQ